MKEPSDKDLEQKFSEWLDNENVNSAKGPIVDDSSVRWQQRQDTAEFIAHQAELTPQQPVPHWDRAASFASENKPWWQWSGLPALSMAFSLFAVSLVVFKVEFIMQDGGMMVSFAGSNDTQQQQKVVNLIDQKLQSFANEQQVILANYAADLTVKQQDTNLQLASYIMGASRQERKEDINDFIQYINDQRADENLDYKLKFQQLEQAINYQGNGNDALRMTPASWTTEE